MSFGVYEEKIKTDIFEYKKQKTGKPLHKQRQ